MRKEAAKTSHITKLLKLQEVQNRNDVKRLRDLHNEAQVHIRSLKSLGVQSDTYSLFLKPIILSKIPQELSVEFFCIDNQRAEDDKLSVENLLDFILTDIEGRELNQFLRKESPTNSGTVQNKQQHKKNELVPTAAQLATQVAQLQKQLQKHQADKAKPAARVATRPCLFCKELHFITHCPMPKAQKVEILNKDGRCLRCFTKEHATETCTRGKPCYNCKDANHHTTL